VDDGDQEQTKAGESASAAEHLLVSGDVGFEPDQGVGEVAFHPLKR
jgi:hypothetical protein